MLHVRERRSQRQEQGVALLVAMIALVVMSLAGVALLRSVDTSALIAGNLAFRQGATNAGDAGVETARTWLANNSAALESDNAAAGYYATRMNAGGVDGRGIDLTGSRTASTADDVRWVKADDSVASGQYTPACIAAKDEAGNKICYVIHRLCVQTGALQDANCSSVYSDNAGGGSAGAM